MQTTKIQRSPEAGKALKDAIEAGLSPFAIEADEMMGDTDCPEGCVVEPDGACWHGYESAARNAGVI